MGAPAQSQVPPAAPRAGGGRRRRRGGRPPRAAVGAAGTTQPAAGGRAPPPPIGPNNAAAGHGAGVTGGGGGADRVGQDGGRRPPQGVAVGSGTAGDGVGRLRGAAAPRGVGGGQEGEKAEKGAGAWVGRPRRPAPQAWPQRPRRGGGGTRRPASDAAPRCAAERRDRGTRRSRAKRGGVGSQLGANWVKGHPCADALLANIGARPGAAGRGAGGAGDWGYPGYARRGARPGGGDRHPCCHARQPAPTRTPVDAGGGRLTVTWSRPDNGADGRGGGGGPPTMEAAQAMEGKQKKSRLL